MLDKLKSATTTVKDILIYILTPLAFVAGAIYYLVTKNQGLIDRLERSESDAKLKEIKNEQDKVDTVADDAVAEYERQRAVFLRDGAGQFHDALPPANPQLRQGLGESKETDRDPGSKT